MKNIFKDTVIKHLEAVKSYGLVVMGLFLVFMGCMRYQGDKDIPKEKFNQPGETVPVDTEIPYVTDMITGEVVVDASQLLPEVYEGVSAEEKQSLVQMVGTLLQFGLDSSKGYDKLSETLRDMGVDPWVMRNANADDASMFFVRTKKRLPGVKNFHAQFMRDGKDSYTQHMSFDFKPSVGSLELAEKAIKALYPKLGAPKLEVGSGGAGTLKSWAIENEMHIYIRVLDEEFVKQRHHFNAYGPDDVGVVRVTIEEDIELW